MLSTPELIIIFLIIMLVYGGTRLPAMGRGLGQGVREFREGLRGDASGGPAVTDATDAKTSKAPNTAHDGTHSASDSIKSGPV